MSVSIAQSTAPQLESLHRTRRVLREEMTRVQHWLRLVHARIDLSVAVVLLPERISNEVCDVLPVEDLQNAPDHDTLARMVRGTSSSGDVFQICELRDLEQQLTRYRDQVRGNLEYATSQLVFHLAQDPYSAVARLTSPV